MTNFAIITHFIAYCLSTGIKQLIQNQSINQSIKYLLVELVDARWCGDLLVLLSELFNHLLKSLGASSDLQQVHGVTEDINGQVQGR